MLNMAKLAFGEGFNLKVFPGTVRRPKIAGVGRSSVADSKNFYRFNFQLCHRLDDAKRIAECLKLSIFNECIIKAG